MVNIKRFFFAVFITILCYGLGRTVALADNVILDDQIVDGSLCVGFDCVNGESFGFDTIRMKENNLRMHFNDTSSSSSFPSNDWRFIFNDSGNGGDNYFGIEDVDSGKMAFRIQAGAPQHTLVASKNGRIGINNQNPVVDLHMISGNTPTVRMEQDGSSGFTPQTWDVAGNEAGFFVRDATNGSTLPFRIVPGAPSSSIHIGSGGDVGLGSAPDSSALLHLKKSDAKILVQDSNSTTLNRIQLSFENKGGSYIEFTDTDDSDRWLFGTDSGNENFFMENTVTNSSMRVYDTGRFQLRPSGVIMLDFLANLHHLVISEL